MHRRDALKSLTLAGAAAALRIDTSAQGEPLAVGGALVEVWLASLSPSTLRIPVVARDLTADLNRDGALAPFDEKRVPGGAGTKTVGDLRVTVTAAPVKIRVADKGGATVQEIVLDDNGVLQFQTGSAPLLAFGEG